MLAPTSQVGGFEREAASGVPFSDRPRPPAKAGPVREETDLVIFDVRRLEMLRHLRVGMARIWDELLCQRLWSELWRRNGRQGA